MECPEPDIGSCIPQNIRVLREAWSVTSSDPDGCMRQQIASSKSLVTDEVPYLRINGHLPSHQFMNLLQLLPKRCAGCLKFELFQGYGTAMDLDGPAEAEVPRVLEAYCEGLVPSKQINEFCFLRDEPPVIVQEQELVLGMPDTVTIASVATHDFDEEDSWRLLPHAAAIAEQELLLRALFDEYAAQERAAGRSVDESDKPFFVHALLTTCGMMSALQRGLQAKAPCPYLELPSPYLLKAWRVDLDLGSSEETAVDPVSLVSWSKSTLVTSSKKSPRPRLMKRAMPSADVHDVLTVSPHNGFDGRRLHPGSVMSDVYADDGPGGITKAHVEGLTQTNVRVCTAGAREFFKQPVLNMGETWVHLAGAPIIVDIVPFDRLPAFKDEMLTTWFQRFAMMAGNDSVSGFDIGLYSQVGSDMIKGLGVTRTVLYPGQKLVLLPGSVACGMHTGTTVLERCPFFAPCGVGLGFLDHGFMYLEELLAIVEQLVHRKAVRANADVHKGQVTVDMVNTCVALGMQALRISLRQSGWGETFRSISALHDDDDGEIAKGKKAVGKKKDVGNDVDDADADADIGDDGDELEFID